MSVHAHKARPRPSFDAAADSLVTHTIGHAVLSLVERDKNAFSDESLLPLLALLHQRAQADTLDGRMAAAARRRLLAAMGDR